MMHLFSRCVSLETFGIAGLITAAGLYIFFGPSNRKRIRSDIPPGLKNLGNTCFLNALLQSLAPCSSFIKWCQQGEKKLKASSLHCSLLDTLKVLNNDSDLSVEVYSPGSVILALAGSHWLSSHEQQDTHELFHAMTDTLGSEVKSTPCDSSLNTIQLLVAPEDSGVRARGGLVWPGVSSATKRAPYQGSLVTQTTCQHCKYKFPNHYDSFDSLTLTLPSTPSIHLSVERLLTLMTRPELVSNATCERCSLQNKAGKQMIVRSQRICRLPQLLVVHIQRTYWTNAGLPDKRHEFVRFSEVMDLSAYTHAALLNIQTEVESKRMDTMNRDVLPFVESKAIESAHDDASNLQTESMCSTMDRPMSSKSSRSAGLKLKGGSTANSSRKSSAKYRLCSVISHMGSADSGHFITYRRCPATSETSFSTRWIYASDNMVDRCSVSDVMAADAYMLFYERT